jgi:hypothetical protein
MGLFINLTAQEVGFVKIGSMTSLPYVNVVLHVMSTCPDRYTRTPVRRSSQVGFVKFGPVLRYISRNYVNEILSRFVPF